MSKLLELKARVYDLLAEAGAHEAKIAELRQEIQRLNKEIEQEAKRESGL